MSDTVRRSVRKRKNARFGEYNEEDEEEEIAVDEEQQKKAKVLKMDDELRVTIQSLLNSMMRNRLSFPFLKPVDATLFPDYYVFIKKPMDFATIQTKVDEGAYNTLDEFASDVRLIFTNCWTYNQPGTEIYKSARVLYSSFEKLIRDIKYQATQAKEEQEISEMQGIINQLKGEHQKLLNELHKLVREHKKEIAATSPPLKTTTTTTTTRPKREVKKKKKKEKKEKKPKVVAPVNAVYHYEYADKERLSNKISKLSPENQQKMADLLSNEISEGGKAGELEIDLESSSDEVLVRLELFVNDCLKEQGLDDPSLQEGPKPPLTDSVKLEDEASSSSESETESEGQDEEYEPEE